MSMLMVPMTRGYAEDLATWTYEPPYEVYSMTAADPGFFLAEVNGFYALVADGELIGYRSFGPDGRVPGYDYPDGPLDTGGGLRPSLTGRGLGREAVGTGLSFGKRRFAPAEFRVTVASFNARAQRVILSLGFVHRARFAASTDGRRYDVFIRPA